MKVHRIVATLFVNGLSKTNNEVNHINGDKSDNSAQNLEWVSHLDNIRHAYKHHLVPKIFGERHGNHTLKDDDIDEICRYLVKNNGNCKETFKEINQYTNIRCTIANIHRIKYKQSGMHISDKYFSKDSFKKE